MARTKLRRQAGLTGAPSAGWVVVVSAGRAWHADAVSVCERDAIGRRSGGCP
nr:hypothetical protein OG781_05345 [Streptomyces sp. NBC_00830]